MLFFLCFLEGDLANVVKKEKRFDQTFNQKKFTIKTKVIFSIYFYKN